MSDMKQLFELNDLAREEGNRYPIKRALFDRLMGGQGRHFVGIVGSRGAGKTVLLRQLLVSLNDAFYLSADTLGGNSLFETARTLATRYGVKTLLVDEIHFHAGFDEELKKLYDFIDLRVVFTSSVSLALFTSAYDLSRRVRLEQLFPFSFREYVWFVQGRTLPALTLEDIYHERFTSEHLRCSHLFPEYLRGGLFPFSLEEPEVMPLLESIISTVVTRDIPSVARLSFEELASIEKTIRFVGRADIDGINYSSISRNIGITKYKAEAYVSLLEKAYIFNRVFPAGANVLKEPKILMYLPYRLIFRSDPTALGGMREDFFAETMRMRGLPFSYLKTKRGAKTPDFLVSSDAGDWVVEVGGRGKGRTQFKGITVDRKLILADGDEVKGIRRPLFLLGFV